MPTLFMSANIIDGRLLAEKIKDKIVKDIVSLSGGLDNYVNHRPNLAIVLVGEREDSRIFVELKEKEAKKVGIDTHLYKCPGNIPENELLAIIKHLNSDDLIDAILVQLPLPPGYDTDGIIRSINPEKDVDRFHPDNLGILFSTCDHQHVLPPVFTAVLEILGSIKYELEDKRVCVVANSDIFGRSLCRVLECRKASAVYVKPDDPDLKNKTMDADVLISAVGKKHFITRDMIAEDAIIIDIGITKEGRKVYGDVDFDEAADKASFITPVPGGVGPLTVATTLLNTLELHKNRCCQK